MSAIDALISGNMLIAWLVLSVTFGVLCKSADVFVDSAVEVAVRTRVPKMIVGLVLVSLATTTPELTVSVIASLRGRPEMALGNAIGSVICDDGLGLPLCALFSSAAIPVLPRVLRTSGVFLLLALIVLTGFVAGDNVLEKWEGGVLLLLFAVYTFVLIWRHRKDDAATAAEIPGVHMKKRHSPVVLTGKFIFSVAGVVAASDLIVRSASSIANGLGVPESVIALVLVAFGTSVPEIATCIAAGRKGEGDVAVGNIIGADIMNICWVAGASAVVNDLVLSAEQTRFMLPSMIAVVVLMLGLLWHRHSMSKRKGLLLLAAYVLFLALLVTFFPPGTTQHAPPGI